MSIDTLHADSSAVLTRSAELHVWTTHLHATSMAMVDASRRTRRDIAACRARSPLRRLFSIARGGSDDGPSSRPTCLKCQEPIEPGQLFVRRFHRYRLVHLVCWTSDPWSSNGSNGDADGEAPRGSVAQGADAESDEVDETDSRATA
jgi:hypothetical protein